MSSSEEPMSNVRMVCEGCAPKPDPCYRKWPMQAFVGKDCKLAFADEVCTEHMWVHCTGLARASGFQLKGTLDSYPVMIADVEHGDSGRRSFKLPDEGQQLL